MNNKDLIEKLENEYKEFANDMMNKSKREILNSSYEINAKEQIKDVLNNANLISTEVEALLNRDGILNEFYHTWVLDDTPVYESMENCIKNSVVRITEEYVKEL